MRDRAREQKKTGRRALGVLAAVALSVSGCSAWDLPEVRVDLYDLPLTCDSLEIFVVALPLRAVQSLDMGTGEMRIPEDKRLAIKDVLTIKDADKPLSSDGQYRISVDLPDDIANEDYQFEIDVAAFDHGCLHALGSTVYIDSNRFTDVQDLRMEGVFGLPSGGPGAITFPEGYCSEKRPIVTELTKEDVYNTSVGTPVTTVTVRGWGFRPSTTMLIDGKAPAGGEILFIRSGIEAEIVGLSATILAGTSKDIQSHLSFQ